MKVLNAYAGIGGNRKFWKNVEVTAVEISPEIAQVYRRLYPADRVIVGDAHAYIAEHFREFDFIWSSPPCQSHSKLNFCRTSRNRKYEFKGRYPDMSLWAEIVFLRQFAMGPWLVENVKPYYQPLLPPTRRVGRHWFWCNFPFRATDVPSPDLTRCKRAELMEWLGIQVPKGLCTEKLRSGQVIRNAVHPIIGEQILTCLQGIRSRFYRGEETLFDL